MSRYVLIKTGLSTFPGLHPSGHWHRWCNCPQRRSLLVQVIRPLKVKPFRPRYHLKFSTFKKISRHQTFLTISLAKKKWRCVTTPGQERNVSLVKLDAFIQQTGRMLCLGSIKTKHVALHMYQIASISLPLCLSCLSCLSPASTFPHTSIAKLYQTDPSLSRSLSTARGRTSRTSSATFERSTRSLFVS